MDEWVTSEDKRSEGRERQDKGECSRVERWGEAGNSGDGWVKRETQMELQGRSLHCSVCSRKKAEMEAPAARQPRSRGGRSRGRPCKMSPAETSCAWASLRIGPVHSCARFTFSSPLMLPEPLFQSNYWSCSMPCLFTTEVTCHSGFQLSSSPPANPRFRSRKRRQIKQPTPGCPQRR